MQNVFVKKVAAAAVAGAIALTSTTAFAAPVASANATLEKAVPGHATNVHYRRWGPGPWVGAAIIGGALAGAAIASANRPYYYYDPYPAYGPGPGYAYEPEPGTYYDAPPPAPQPAPGPAYPRRCWVEGGVNGQSGYWAPC